MNIRDTHPDEFARILNEVLSPSNPVRREELLQGREKQLKQIDRAMPVSGRSIFVWGPRGVGKTSVGQTSAFAHQPPGTFPILLACDKNTSASKLIVNMVEDLLNPGALPGSKKSVSGKLTLPFVELSGGAESGGTSLPAPTNIHEAVRLLRAALDRWNKGQPSRMPVVVVDEFDLLGTTEDRHFFGDLIKQIGDQQIPLHLVFCGVSHSLHDLLEGHASAHRYIESIELERLYLDASMNILRTAGVALGGRFHEDHLFRIAQISDGFPYYVHLIGAAILWEKFEDPNSSEEVSSVHYEVGLQKAVESCDANLRHLYEKATRKYTEGYDHILWAAAAHSQLQRRSADIFDDYVRIERTLRKQHDFSPDKQEFYQKINRLKSDTHGSVLLGTRQGWYEFQVPILRGYCRLMAKQSGVDLGDEYAVSRPFPTDGH